MDLASLALFLRAPGVIHLYTAPSQVMSIPHLKLWNLERPVLGRT